VPHQVGNGLAAPHDGHLFTPFDQREQPRQVRLGLVDIEVWHVSILAKKVS